MTTTQTTETFLASPTLTPREGDLFNIDAALTEEERAVRDSVRRFVDERVLPISGNCYVEGRFPKELTPYTAAPGRLGANRPEADGCAGLNDVRHAERSSVRRSASVTRSTQRS